MDNTIEKQVESLEHQKFDQALFDKKTNTFNKLVKYFILGLGIFSLLVYCFALFDYFFIGVADVFGVTFSLQGIASWLDSIPSIKIVDPEAMLVRIILGALFCGGYLLLGISLVVSFIKVIKRFNSLVDLENTRLNHKLILHEIMVRTSNAVSRIFAFALFSISASRYLNSGEVAFYVVLGLFTIVANVILNLYTSYDTKTLSLEKKVLALNLSKIFSIILISSILVVVTSASYFDKILNNVANQINRNIDMNIYLFLRDYGIPLLDFIVFWISLSLLRNMVSLTTTSPLADGEIAVDKPPKKSLSNVFIKDALSGRFAGIIFLSIVSFLLNVLVVLISDGNILSLPANFVEVVVELLFTYLPIILLTIAINVISNTEHKVVTYIDFVAKK